MSDDRFGDWARRRQSQRRHVHIEPPTPQPPPEPQQLVRVSGAPWTPNAAPSPAPVLFYAPQQPVYQPQRFQHYDTCAIVRPDKNGIDCYGNLLSQIPEIGVPNYNPQGVDAMKLPRNGRFEKWTPTAQRTYGGRDGDTQQRLEDHVGAQYGASTETPFK